MSGFAEINSEMAAVAKEIEILSGQLEEKRTIYEQAKHAFEVFHAGLILSGKVENPEWTQTDLAAHALKESAAYKAEMILAHAAYRKLRSDLSSKRETLDTIKEKGWNLRQELKRLSY